MQAVILAAGMGKRLRPITDRLPKGLVEIEGKPLLEYSLNALIKNGIKDVVLVVGFLGGMFQQRFGNEYRCLKIEYVENKEYDKTGSMYSLTEAEGMIKGDIILLESDLLYDPMAIEILLNSELKDCFLVSKLSNSGDEVYICVDDNQKIIELGKNISNESKKCAIGEMVGISKFSRGLLKRVFKEAKKDYGQNHLNRHYEERVFLTSKSGFPIYALLCDDLDWIEIDKMDDLKRAKEKKSKK